MPERNVKGEVVKGAEDVGSMSVVKEMAPAFDLGGLFEKADAGAFEDCEMVDGDVGEEGDGMQIEQDDDDV